MSFAGDWQGQDPKKTTRRRGAELTCILPQPAGARADGVQQGGGVPSSWPDAARLRGWGRLETLASKRSQLIARG